jgi:D-3-phosphoglycerate dehydrogenase
MNSTQSLTSFPKEKIKILLLEGIHPDGVEMLKREGYSVECHRGSFDEQELLRVIEGVSVLGIRSKTLLTKRALERASGLLTVGAFCIGTNQIDLSGAATAGVPVFNAPFSNTRSVAEMVIAEIVMLLRRLPDKIRKTGEGVWDKTADGCVEVRGKTLGIIGYGHIGSQVSILAEAMGMRVIYHDIVEKLSMGNAVRVPSLNDVLEQAEVVTLHVPETRLTKGMIGKEQLARMKPGSFLINTSRGSVVDVDELAESIRSGRLAGAGADVFPREPKTAGDPFETPLQGLPNVILTPHIGGSTIEAQRNISTEVAGKLIMFLNNGSTNGAVNFPNLVLPELEGAHRILHIHRNVPGVMRKVNTMFGKAGFNIEAQFLRTQGDIGYLIMDTDHKARREMVDKLRAMPETIKVRAIF